MANMVRGSSKELGVSLSFRLWGSTCKGKEARNSKYLQVIYEEMRLSEKLTDLNF